MSGQRLAQLSPGLPTANVQDGNSASMRPLRCFALGLKMLCQAETPLAAVIKEFCVYQALADGR